MNKFRNFLLLSVLLSYSAIVSATESKPVISQFTGEVFEVSILSQEKLDTLFEDLRTNQFIPFEVVSDGCYARTYLMIMTARLKNINLGKIVVDVKNKKEQVIEIPIPDHKWILRWYYHVAPMVFVRNESNGEIEERIIDPSLFNRPLSRKEFVDQMRLNPLVELDIFLLPPLVSDKNQLTADVNIEKLDRNMLINMKEAEVFATQFGRFLEKAPLLDRLQDKCFQGGLEIDRASCN